MKLEDLTTDELFSLYWSRFRYTEAMDRILHYYPESTRRLAMILRLRDRYPEFREEEKETPLD